MRSTARAFFAFAAVLTALLVAFYSSCLFGHASFYLFDIQGYFQPVFAYIGARLKSGELPLWNPYALSGVSQAALIVPGIFYPLNWLYAFFGFNQAYATMLLVQQLAGGIGLFALLRVMRVHVLGCAFAGLAFALSGLLFSMQIEPHLQGPVCWLTLSWAALLGIACASPSRKLVSTAASAVAAFMMVSCSSPELFAPAYLLLAGTALVGFCQSNKAGRRNATIVLILRSLALLLSLFLAAGTLLPLAEWARLSQRASGLPIDVVFAWSASWYDLVCLFCAQPLGDLFSPFNQFRPLVQSAVAPVPYFANVFVGPATLTLCFWGAGDKTWKERRIALALLAVFLLISLSGQIPVLVQLCDRLNLRAFRYPIKEMAFVVLALALMSGRGMHAFINALPNRGVSWSAIFWGTCAVVALGLLSLAVPLGLSGALAIPTHWQQVYLRFGCSLLLSSVLGLLYVFLWKNRRAYPRAAAAIIIASSVLFSFIDAWMFTKHDGPANFYTEPSFAALKVKELSPRGANLFRCAALYESVTVSPALLNQSHPIFSVAYAAHQLMPPLVNMSFGIDNVTRGNLEETADHASVWHYAMSAHDDGNDVPLAIACRMSAANLLLCRVGTEVGAPLPNPRFFEPAFIDPGLEFGIFKVKRAMPRAYFASGIKWGAPHEAVVKYLTASDKSGFDPGKSTILEHTQGMLLGPKLAVDEQALKTARAEFFIDKPEHLSLKVYTSTANFLVVTDQYYPGWSAVVDGSASPLVPANLLFRAVLVPSGSHTVDFFFRPASLRNGVLLQVVALSMLLGLLLTAAVLAGRRQF